MQDDRWHVSTAGATGPVMAHRNSPSLELAKLDS